MTGPEAAETFVAAVDRMHRVDRLYRSPYVARVYKGGGVDVPDRYDAQRRNPKKKS